MVVYKCLFCYYETIKKTSMRDHYNKNKKCYKEEDIINYENLENLIIKSKEENNLIVKPKKEDKIKTIYNKYKCLFCNFITDKRYVLNNHYQKKNKCYTENDKLKFINLENMLDESKCNNLNSKLNNNSNINITIKQINNCVINNNISNANYINDIFNESFDHIDIPKIIQNNDIESIFDNLIDSLLEDKSNYNILIKHPNDSICQVLNTDKNGNKKLEYMPIEKTYKRLMEKLGKILLPVVNKLAIKEDFPDEAMDKVCGITLFLALVKNKNIKNTNNKVNHDEIKIGAEIKNFYQARKNSYSCKYSNKYNEIYESIYKYLETNTNILDDIDDDSDSDTENNLLEF